MNAVVIYYNIMSPRWVLAHLVPILMPYVCFTKRTYTPNDTF